MRRIPLTQGKFALVDDSDFESINQFKWYACRNYKTFYARRNTPTVNGKRKTVLMHAVVAGKLNVDHADGNGLNNQRANLRPASRAQQTVNQRLRADNTSGYRGVSGRTGRWEAYIGGSPRVHIGYFSDPVIAARAYDAEAKKYFGAFARLNFPQTATKPN